MAGKPCNVFTDGVRTSASLPGNSCWFIGALTQVWSQSEGQKGFNPNLLLSLSQSLAHMGFAAALLIDLLGCLDGWLEGDKLEGKWLNCPHSHCWNANSPPLLASTVRTKLRNQGLIYCAEEFVYNNTT